MLHHLVEYAERTGLVGEAGFKPKQVRWLLMFDSQGKYLSLAAASTDSRIGREFPKSPHLQFSGDTPMRQFLVDSAHYALLFGPSEPDRKLLTKHQFFLKCLTDAAEAEPVLGKIAKSLAEKDTLDKVHQELDRQTPKAKPTDNVTFVEMTPAGPRILVEQTTWHDWWRGYWPTLFAKKDKKKGKSNSQMRCFLSGDLTEPLLTHPKIKGLGNVGGNVETSLVGFNLEAFCSYGLEQSANAAVGTEAAETYAAALNNLIANQSKRLANTRVVYWYTASVPPDDDPVPELEQGIFGDAEVEESDDEPINDHRAQSQATSRAGKLLEAIRTGNRPDLKGCRYRVLTLTGNAGRAVVQDWIEGEFAELAGNIDAWFRDLAIVHRYGIGLAPQPKFMAVLGSLFRDLKDAPRPIESALWRAALTGGPIPQEAAGKALARFRIDEMAGEPANHARMGLLKAFLIRKEKINMTAEVNNYLDHPAYQCGQIMAILGKIQEKALGDVGAGIIQRYYAAASATPALIIGRLVRLAQAGHLPKIEPAPLRRWFDNQLAEAWNRLRRDPPAVLDLTGQTLFAMGYYQQKAKRPDKSVEAESDKQ